MNLSEILLSLREIEREKKGYGTPPESCPTPQWHPRLLGNCLVCMYQFLTSNFNFKTTQIFKISYFHKFY